MDTNKKRAKRRGLLIAILIIVIIIILLLLRSCGGSVKGDNNVSSQPESFSTEIDQNAGERSDLSQEQIVDDLNQKVEKGFITISMNAAPVFADGSAKGNLQIFNSSKNNYPQVVQIVDNTGKLLYESGLIPVGQGVEYAALNEQLPAGRYPCTAIFHNVDPESGLSLGRAQAAIAIVVTN